MKPTLLANDSGLSVIVKVLTFYFLATFVGQNLSFDLAIHFVHYLSAEFPYWQKPIANFVSIDSGRILSRISDFVGVVAVYCLFIKLIDRQKISQSVLFPANKLKSFVMGAELGGGLCISMIGLILLSNSIRLVPQDNWLKALVPIILLYVIIMLLTAIAEELIIRGYLLHNLMRKINPHLAILMTATVFGYWHIHNGLLYGTMAFLFGVLAGYIYLWKGNLYCTIGMHWAWNCVESIVFSKDLFRIDVTHPMLAGAKNITPDQEGLISLPIMLIGIISVFYLGKLWKYKFAID